MTLNIQIKDDFIAKVLLDLKKDKKSWDDVFQFLLIKSGILVGKKEVQVKLGSKLKDYLLSDPNVIGSIVKYIKSELTRQGIPLEYLENQFVEENLERAARMILHSLVDGRLFSAIKFTVGNEVNKS